MTVFAESAAPLLQVVHTLLAVAAVGAATHLALWLRGHRVGRPRRHAAARRFAALSAGLCVATFVLGLVIYPTYRTRVRAEYFDHPAAIASDYQQRLQTRDTVAAQHGAASGGETSAQVADGHGSTVREQTRRAAKLSRWFDIKEHWAAIFSLTAIAVYLVLRGWRRGAATTPDDAVAKAASSTVGAVAFWAATLTAIGLWACAIIGLFVANARSL